MLFYILSVFLSLFFTACAYPLAFIVAIFVNKDGNLPSFLSWFQSYDSNFYGYEGFNPPWPRSYWSNIKWIWRNGTGFDYSVLGIDWIPDNWTIDKNITDAFGNIIFSAHDRFGNFCYFTDGKNGHEYYGHKAHNNNVFDGNKFIKGQAKIPFCFTPKNPFN